MDLKTIRRAVAGFQLDGFLGLSVKPDGGEMNTAYVVLCPASHMPYDTSGFIGIKHYMPGKAIEGEVGCVELTRFVLDESLDVPVFIKDASEYQLYPATRDKQQIEK